MKRCNVEKFLALCIGLSIAQYTFGDGPVSGTDTFWQPLAQDELHDPTDPALNLLHGPAEVLAALPHDGSGNQVNWVKALEDGNIKPLISIHSKTLSEVLDLDVLMRNTDEMGMVNFSHKQHTEWLTCKNCHESIFKFTAGTTKFGMLDILNGEYCGRCHSTVAFPLTECNRCHNVPRTPTSVSPRRVE